MFWFKKAPKSKRLEDKVYINDQSKFQAIGQQIKPNIANATPIFIVYYFDESKEKVIKKLEEQQIKFRSIENEFAGNLNLSSEEEVYLIKARTLDKVLSFKFSGSKTDKQALNFLFVEHYPVYSKEEAILTKIDSLTDHKAFIWFYVSLDEPLLEVFGSDNIKVMMRRLGLSENECIEHSLVTKSIANAQKKLENKVVSDSDAPSQAAWFKKNHIPK